MLVVGRLRPDPQTGSPRVFTRKDGTTGSSYEINAINVRFLPSGSGGGGGFSQDLGDPQGGAEDDEIPF